MRTLGAKPRLWRGIDPGAIDLIWRAYEDGRLALDQRYAARRWLRSCLAAGLPTDLNADLLEPQMAEHLRRSLAPVEGPTGVAREDPSRIRRGLLIYKLALEAGLRNRPIPAIAQQVRPQAGLDPSTLLSLLPEADQAKLRGIDRILDDLVVLNWRRRGGPASKTSDGRQHRPTIAERSAIVLRSAVRVFLRHAHRRGWTFTLDELLTPEHVVDFAFYGETNTGRPLALATASLRVHGLLDYFRRGRTHRPAVVVIDEAREQAIRKAIEADHAFSHLWNVDATGTRAGDQKWFPDIKKVETALAALEEKIRRADQMYELGSLTRLVYWREIRDTVIAICDLVCMWRLDTECTISVAHFRRFASGSLEDENGFAIVENIARAKSANSPRSPFVPELIIPSIAVMYIKKLLAIEGRSLEQPLSPGQAPIRLSEERGDRWGNTHIPCGTLEVVPLFRLHPDRPEPLSYGAISYVLRRTLSWLGYKSTNPHMFRVSGAIYWTFVRGMPETLVMALGLWKDPEVLRRCYAHLGTKDRMALMAQYVPAMAGVVPNTPSGGRGRIASQAIRTLSEMVEKPTTPYEAQRFMGQLHRHYEQIEQTIADDLGKKWEPVRKDPLEAGELERIDLALRGAGYSAGIQSVLGRPVFPSDQLRGDGPSGDGPGGDGPSGAGGGNVLKPRPPRPLAPANATERCTPRKLTRRAA